MDPGLGRDGDPVNDREVPLNELVMRIDLQPRWREELVARSEQGTLVFELTMGKMHLCFPSPELWASSVPPWALPLWPEFEQACRDWCQRQAIPMTVTDHTFVYALADKAE